MLVEFPLRNTQIIGNIGLYYVCYELSVRAWNVMQTARNAKGPDVLIYNHDASRTLTIQVKTLTGKTNVRFGKSKEIFGNFLVICLRFTEPVCFVLPTEEVGRLARSNKKRTHFWLEPRDYDKDQYRDNWERIGWGGHPPVEATVPDMGEV